MKQFLIPLSLGVLIEAGLGMIAFASGIGPCGGPLPTMVVLMIHSPGVFLFNKIGIHEPMLLLFLFAAYAALW